VAAEKRKSKPQPEAVRAYLEAKGWDFKEKGNNYQVHTCVFCGNPNYNLEVHAENGMYNCWACSQKGSFYDLRKSQGDLAFTTSTFSEEESQLDDEAKEGLTNKALGYHDRLFQRPVPLQYLRTRGFNDEAIEYFKLGAKRSKGGFEITIPHWVGKEVMNIKYRTLPPAECKWRQEGHSRKVLFNQNALEDNDEIILAEGELKAVALWQHGFKNVVSLTGGVATLRPEWFDVLQKCTRINLMMDMDDPGQLAAEKLSMRLGPERCHNIELPKGRGKDADEYFLKGGTPEDLELIIKRTKKMNVKNITTLNLAFGRLLDRLRSENQEDFIGLQTPWPNVNKMIKGMRPGQLIVVTAPPKIGKTTFTLNIASYQAGEIGNPVLFFCMEMGPVDLAEKIACAVMKKNVEEIFAADQPDDLLLTTIGS